MPQAPVLERKHQWPLLTTKILKWPNFSTNLIPSIHVFLHKTPQIKTHKNPFQIIKQMHQHQGLNHPSHPKQTEKPNEIQKRNTLLSPRTLNRHNLRDKIVPSLFHRSPKPESAPTAFKILPSSAMKNLLGDKNPKISLWVIPMKIMKRNKH